MKKIFSLVALCCMGIAGFAQTISSTTYPFTSTNGVSLVDMSTGTTQIIGSGGDDPVSSVTSIGFDFWFNGVRHTQFSANGNGLIRLGSTVVTSEWTNTLTGSANYPLIAPYWDDLWVGPSGKVHYKVTGTAPNRVLVVEWKNIEIPRASGTTGSAVFQAWLSESTGKIEFAYGAAMVLNSTNSGASIGFASSGTVFSSVTTTGPTCAYGTANNTNTAAITSGTKYTFTPATPNAPTSLSFAASTTSMVLNWADASSNEVGFVVYSSADGVNYTYATQTAANATTTTITGLSASTTYYFKVYAVTEGALSTALSGSSVTTGCSLSGTKTVGPTGDYTTLTSAFTAVAANGLSGPLALELQTTYTGETFPITIGNYPCVSATNNITIRPQGSMTVTSTTAAAMISMNGARYVTIDGRVGSTGSTNALTLYSNSTSGSVIQLINDASNNTIKYATLRGINTSTIGGVVLFSTTTGTTGNDNNTIDNCDILDGVSSRPVNCIYASGTSGKENSGNTISNCNIANFYHTSSASNGIFLTSGNTEWTINNNRLYQTATRSYTSSQTNRAIQISNTSGNNFTVTNNTIGYSSSAGSGTYSMTSTSTTVFHAITMSVGTSAPSSVQGNTITNISFTSTNTSSTAGGTMCGISVTSGSVNIGTTSGNTIGAATGNGAITTTINTSTGGTMVGINGSASNPSAINIQNNIIGGLTLNNGSTTIGGGLQGIQISSTGSYTVTGNTIGSTSTTNSLYMPTVTTGTQILHGINSAVANTVLVAPVISNNVVCNLTALGTGASSTAAGIFHSGSAPTTISGNSVKNISSATTNTSIGGQSSVSGIGYSGAGTSTITQNTVNAIAATNTSTAATNACGISLAAVTSPSVTRNRVYDIRNASTGTTATSPPRAVGILLFSPTTTANVANNMISLGNTQTTNTIFVGILNHVSVTATLNVFYNTVNIEGTVSSGALPTACFHRGSFSTTALTTPVDIRNNVFTNTRTGGTGKHYAIANGIGATGTSTGWGSGASNYNVLNATSSSTIGYWGAADRTFAAWQSSSAGDGNSYTAATLTYTNSSTGDLHINMGTTANNLESHGIAISGFTTDYDNNARPGPVGSINGGGFAPDLGADEFDGTPIDNIPPIITYTALAGSCGTGNRTFNATIADPGGVPTTGTLRPRVYYRKNSGTWFSSPGLLVSGTATSGTWAFTITATDMGGLAISDNVQYFVIAQDISGSIASVPSTGLVATDVNTVSTYPTTPNSYTVLAELSGTYTVGSGGDYTTITAAVAAYNGACLSGPVVFNLTSSSYASETLPITINANSFASATNTLTIKPATGVNATISGSSTTAIFKLNGADYVTIDGSNSGGTSKNLTISNTYTSSSAVIWNASLGGTGNGADNNTFKNLNIIGGSVSATALLGITSSSTSGVTALGDNNNNLTIQNCNISKAYYGIGIYGSVSFPHSGLTITQDSIGSSSSANYIGLYGIYLTNQTSPVISQNTIYNLKLAPSANPAGIEVAANVTGAQILRNNITGIWNENTGGWGAYGINISGSGCSNITIANNFISDIHIINYSVTSTTFNPFGIRVVASVNTLKIYYNTINFFGSTSIGTSAGLSANLLFTASQTNLDVRDNIFVNTFSNSSSGSLAYNVYLSTSVTFSNSNYNSYYGASSSSTTYNTGYTGSAVAATLANWRTYTTQDVNSISNSPTFNSSSDLHLQIASGNVPFIAGTPISGFTTDIDGTTRSGSTPVIGAHEVNIPPCTAPALPTSLTYAQTATTITLNFTPAVTAPTGYILVSSTGTLVGSPTTGQAVTVGTAVGSNGTIVANITTGSTINLSSLTANTAYTLTLFPYNNTACVSGPAFNTTATSDVVATCPNAPSAPTAGTTTPSTIPISWVAPAAGGSAYTSYTYLLNVYADTGLTIPVYTNVSATSPYTITGLASGTTYWFTITAVTPACSSVASAAGNATTEVVPCSGTPTTGSVVASATTGCSPYVSNLSLAGASGEGGITYQWQNSSDSSSWANITGATNSTYSATLSSTMYYRATLTCTISSTSASSAGKKIAVTPVPATITGSAALCMGATGTLSNASAGGTWSSANTSVATIGPSTGVVAALASGTATISYVTGCGTAASKVITVNIPPAAVTITPSTSSTICLGAASTFTASASMGTTTIVDQNWNSGMTGTTGGTWTITNTAGVATSYWQIRTPPGYSGSISGDGSAYMQAAPDATTANTTTIFTSPSFSTMGLSSATLTYNQNFSIYSGDVVVAVEYSTNGGSSWTTLVNQLGVSDGTTTWTAGTPQKTVSLPGGALGQGNVMLRWNYNSTYGFYWTIDNIKLTGTAPTPTYAWEGVGGAAGIACGSCASTAITPTASGANVYSVTATLNGCTTSSSVTVNANTLPTAQTVTGGGGYCAGGSGPSVGLVSSQPGINYQLYRGSTTVGTPIPGTGSAISFGTFTTAGTYSVLATNATTGCSQGMPGTATISINPLPVAQTVTGGGSYCEGGSGLTVGLGGTQAGVIYQLYNGATTAGSAVSGTGSSLSFGTFTMAGTYSVLATSTEGCQSNMSNNVTISINALPVANTVTGGGSYCSGAAGLSIGMAATESATIYQLYRDATVVGSPTPGTGSSISFGTFATAGTYSVSAINAEGCTNNMANSVSISINALPTAYFTTGGGAYCAGDAGASIGLEGSETGITYQLYNGASTAGSPVAGTGGAISFGTYSAAGTYSVLATNTTTSCAKAMSSTATISINPLPETITGTMEVCPGSTTTLANTTSGGSWISDDPEVAAIDGSGITSGVSDGTATITYMLPTGCYQTTIVTVNPLPTGIEGTTSVCVGLTTTLYDGPAGGMWNSGSTAVATIGLTSGIVTGVTAGTANITYTLPTGCMTDIMVTVNPLPADITGSAVVCQGATTTLSSTTSGGIWLSGTTGVAGIDAAGVVTAVSAGTSTITYMLGSGCQNTTMVTVNPLPAAITGPATLCIDETITLNSATPGGIWSGIVSTVATMGTSGVVTGIAAGATNVTYTLPTGCQTSTTITVNPLPPSITGATTICEGTVATLSIASAGGSWSSSNPSVATINSEGVVSGIAAGSTTISYHAGTGCASAVPFVVNPLPSAITGPGAVCIGSTITLEDAVSGGSWSSSLPSVATVDGSGVVSGIAAGVTNITYTVGTGCQIAAAVTVNPLPAIILGTFGVCQGSTATVSNTTTGGAWSSSDPAVATITAGTGIYTGVAGGTAVITYTLPTGCFKNTTVTVNPQPSAIAGTASVCIGFTTSLSNTTEGGMWSSNNTTVATIGSSTGVVNGLAAGTATITYMLTTGCSVTKIVTVNVLPNAITGNAGACAGASTTLASTTTGGTWSSSNTAIATVGSTGIVSGISSGTATITYMLPTGCVRTAAVNITNTPSSISGTLSACAGSTSALSNTVSGGAWSSSNAAIATVGSTSGVVTGVAGGTARITYATGPYCYTTSIFTVNPISPITGVQSACVGLNTTLSDATTGGTWSSSNASVATIGSTGIVTGIAMGTSVITYTLPTGCFRTVTVNISGLPGAIGGASNVCISATATLSNDVSGGGWSSSAPTIATIGSASGILTGVAAGTARITYSIGTGCNTTSIITVNPLPTTITGTMNVCIGATRTLANATTGGSWSSASTTIATVGASTGVVTGVAGGTVAISYTSALGCSRSAIMTVNNLPVITGASTVCPGSKITLSATPTGGTWSSSTAAVGTVISTSGVVTGITAGTTNITYRVATGCESATVVSVNPSPAAITGTLKTCIGMATTLSSATSGGTWSVTNPAIATIGTTDGVANGVATGTTAVTYTIATGCRATGVITVNPLPAAITGTTSVCVGSTATLANVTSGGTWASSNPAVATIGSTSKVVTGITTGTTTITYLLTTGCYQTTTVTVNAVPATIGGTKTVCAAATTSLSNTVSGGTWASSNASVATVGGTTGVVTGVVNGTANITYSLGSGCRTTATVTVYPVPAAITGTLSVCTGSVTTLADATLGGAWSTGNATVATVSAVGVVSGVSAGTATISYSLGTGCAKTAVVTVNPLPTAILGTTTVCVGITATLSDSTAGGTWKSSNPTIANIISTTGVVTGMGIGTSMISYTLPTGCRTTMVLSVNALPSAIGGTMSVCEGAVTTLSDATSGGAWSSGNATVATVGSATGIVSGVAAGTAAISYGTSAGCYRTAIVTVNPVPAAITGTMLLCAGSSTTLSSATTPSVSWISSNIAVATVNSEGHLSGVSAGTATITYTIGSGCKTMAVVTIDPLPSTISGTLSTCIGMATTLGNTISGGVWNSGNTSVATINAATGEVTGISTGTSIVTYTTGICSRTAVVTVNPFPAAITGNPRTCIGTTTVLSDATFGGTWSSSDAAIASIGVSSGTITGNATGTAVITYTLPTGCYVTIISTVTAVPSANTGTPVVCVGSVTTLSNSIPLGTWSSNNTAIATAGSSTGNITGVLTGLTTITYSISSTCYTTTAVTVLPVPSAITGTATVCKSTTTNLSTITAGGTWVSGDVSIATISSTSGVVTGVEAGTSLISYMLPTGCMATKVVTVNPQEPITGLPYMCIGLTSSLNNALTGGVWSSGNTGIATVDASGTVTGVATGTSTISYQLPTGCTAMMVVTVYPLPSAITGSANVCIGLTTTLANSISGGTWSSGATAIATVNNTSGVVTGVSAGTAAITYTLGTGCSVELIVTVNPLPAAITGTPSVCVGLSTALSNTTTGGTWSSSNTSVATVDVSGNVTGIVAGTAAITYTIGTGCYSTVIVTVNPLPAAIGGVANVCAGSTTTLTNATTGGAWSSGNAAIATVDASGIVTGVAAGNVEITYTLSTGCISAAVVTVNPLPATITGSSTVCQGLTTTLGNTSTGGTWASSNTSVATVTSSTGIVSGIVPGTTTITYTLPTGCAITANMTVDPLAAITGTMNVCEGFTVTLDNANTGGTWTSDNTTVATVDPSSGVVIGITAGNATISYTLSTGCAATAVITVNPLPATISGSTTICVGSTQAYTDAVSGGTWSSSSAGTISIGSASGMATGISSGVATISYTLSTGCYVTTSVTSYPIATLSGIAVICAGSTSTLVADITGGIWSSGNPAIATVGSTGAVTGIVAGTAEISYTLGTGCSSIQVVTINPLPTPITGPSSVCAGYTITLSNVTPGGTWSSNNTSVATIDVTTGVLTGTHTGISPATATISYSPGAGCGITAIITVNPLPLAIGGAGTMCVGSSITLNSPTSGGTWSSGNTSIATVIMASGITTGVAAGNATITYTRSNGCYRTADVTVNPLPAAITGSLTSCVGTTSTLASTTTGGTWASSSTGVATINTSTGAMTGMGTGTSTITYTISTGCYVTAVVTVNALPSAISGTLSFCVGNSTTLSSTTIGGAWSSTNPSAATVSGSGVVTGVAAGTSTISYTLGTGCAATAIVTANPLPAAIAGSSTLCVGLSITLTNTTTGGTFSSSHPTIANTTPDGVVTGMSTGTSTITYTAPGGCRVTTVVSVSPLPLSILGTATLCQGANTTLTNSTSGGTWSSGNTSVATVDVSSGVVTAIAGGTATISYITGAGCYSTKVVTVNATPSAITGTTSLCVGTTSTLSSATTPAVSWMSSNTSVATVNSSLGIVTGVAGGTANITYTVGSGCYTTTTVTINALPATISGTMKACIGLTTSLSNADAGGTWLSTNTAVATIGSSTGVVSGVATGTSLITYTLPTGCRRTGVVSVNPQPAAIGGYMITCIGTTTTLTDATSGGTWSSGSTGIATVPSTPGAVTGVSAGTVNITYMLSTGCFASAVVTVNPVPSANTGTPNVCIGSSTTLSNALTGGSWSSNNTAIATVGSGTGIVNGVLAGNTTITYAFGAGCRTTTAVTVKPIPAAIAGTFSVCATLTTTLTSGTGGGLWSSTSTSVATVGSVVSSGTGLVTGVSTGTTTISYTLSNGCARTAVVTVNSCIRPAGEDTKPGDQLVTLEGVDVRIYPNPNNGSFTLKGTLPSATDNEGLFVEVTDILGQVIYKDKLTTQDGRIEQPIALQRTVANGMYMLTVRSANEKKVFHFVIEQ